MNPFSVNWNNKAQVIAFAKSLRSGLVVFSHPDRKNYCITFASRPERYKGGKVIFRT